MDIKKTGQIIKEARENRGLTQKELAGRLHISDRTVSKWERGAGFPDVTLLEPLSDELGITVQSLISGRLDSAESSGEDDAVRNAVRFVYRQTRQKNPQKHCRNNRRSNLSWDGSFCCVQCS